ncbi:MAG: hypothetical protein IJ343_09770 [Clostridia bacterium]|nr:hypothetical protein [Clostridia bacterium]
MATVSVAPQMTIESVRERIRALYERAPHIRISMAAAHSRLVQDSQVVIVGVYPHVFCVEEPVGGTLQRHTFQYADVITRRIVIEGL